MPSPLGHSLAGALVYHTRARGAWSHDWKMLLFLIFCANCSDLDFVPGFFLGDVYRYHHGVSHSLAGSLMMGLVLWMIYGWWRRRWSAADAGLIVLAVLLHPLLDLFVADPQPPYGCPVAYPITDASWMSPLVFFKRTSLREPVLGSSNLAAFLQEFLVLSPLVAAASVRRPKRWIWFAGVAMSLCAVLSQLHWARPGDEGMKFQKVLTTSDGNAP